MIPFLFLSVSLSLQLPAYHFTQAHTREHTFHLHKPNKTNQLFLRIHGQLFIQSCSEHSSGVARWQTRYSPLSLLAKEFSKRSKRCNWFNHCPHKQVSSLKELELFTRSYICETFSSPAAGKCTRQLDRSSITLLKMFFHYPDSESKYLVVSDTA